MTDHEREPCFVCERREREEGQILCKVCIAWAQVSRRKPDPEHCEHHYRADLCPHCLTAEVAGLRAELRLADKLLEGHPEWDSK